MLGFFYTFEKYNYSILEYPENEIILSAEESKHAIKVLHKKEGDMLNLMVKAICLLRK